MAKINWYWFIIIGVTVTVISAFTPKLMFFIIFGGFFIIFGLGRLTVVLKTKKEQEENSAPVNKFQHTQKQREYHEAMQLHRNNARQVIHYKICPQCGVRLRLQDNFCSSCGTALPNQPQRAHPIHKAHPHHTHLSRPNR